METIRVSMLNSAVFLLKDRHPGCKKINKKSEMTPKSDPSVVFSELCIKL